MKNITLKNDKDVFVNEDNTIKELKSVFLTFAKFDRYFLTIISFILLLIKFNNCEKKLTINLFVSSNFS